MVEHYRHRSDFFYQNSLIRIFAGCITPEFDPPDLRFCVFTLNLLGVQYLLFFPSG